VAAIKPPEHKTLRATQPDAAADHDSEAEFEAQEKLIKKLIDTLNQPNFKLIEKYVLKQRNHDMTAT
jgi:hypothetical protein